MDFRTIVDIPTPGFTIGHHQKGLLIGSCFAASIGERMLRGKMPVTINPFGVVYNPLSVIRTLEMVEQGEFQTEEDLTYHSGLWFSFTHHGSFAAVNPQEALCRINRSIAAGHRAFTEADYVVLTLGTAWVYALQKSGEIVGNCHKLPASAFCRFRLEVDAIVDSFDGLLQRSPYREKPVLLTVSPVRHLKDGAVENQRSKATLLLAVHRLVEKYANVHYFPAYEVLMDELRDYRFYERDMLHPSALAVDYIWERFAEALISADSRRLMQRIDKILAAREHRPFNPETPQHRAFKASVLADIRQLLTEYPFLNFSEELHYFSD